MQDLQQRLAALEATVRNSEQRRQATEQRLAATETEMTTARGEMGRMKRRLRATWTCAFVGAVGAVILGSNPQARAQFGVTLTSLNNRLTVVENKTQDMSRSPDPNTGQTTVRFSNVNVQIVDGSGGTAGTVNGRGNLIVGYNEVRGSGDDRTGSHNLIVGARNNYSSFGGQVVGDLNTISNFYASVSGGENNTASGESASISGGLNNIASSSYASVSGGLGNTASGFIASVSGGQNNTASGGAASISGGQNNTASGDAASVSGGQDNDAAGALSSVSGGSNRDIASTGLHDWKAGSLFQDF